MYHISWVLIHPAAQVGECIVNTHAFVEHCSLWVKYLLCTVICIPCVGVHHGVCVYVCVCVQVCVCVRVCV